MCVIITVFSFPSKHNSCLSFTPLFTQHKTMCVLCAQLLNWVWLFETPWLQPVNYSAHGIFQARILEWVAISYSRWFSRPRNSTESPPPLALTVRFFSTVPPGKSETIQRFIWRSHLEWIIELSFHQFSRSVMSDSSRPHKLSLISPWEWVFTVRLSQYFLYRCFLLKRESPASIKWYCDETGALVYWDCWKADRQTEW